MALRDIPPITGLLNILIKKFKPSLLDDLPTTVADCGQCWGGLHPLANEGEFDACTLRVSPDSYPYVRQGGYGPSRCICVLPKLKPSAIACNRIRPHYVVVVPGGPSPFLLRYPPNDAIIGVICPIGEGCSGGGSFFT